MDTQGRRPREDRGTDRTSATMTRDAQSQQKPEEARMDSEARMEWREHCPADGTHFLFLIPALSA